MSESDHNIYIYIYHLQVLLEILLQGQVMIKRADEQPAAVHIHVQGRDVGHTKDIITSTESTPAEENFGPL